MLRYCLGCLFCPARQPLPESVLTRFGGSKHLLTTAVHRYMGPAPEADNVFGCVKRTPLGVLLCLFLEPEAPVTDVLKALSTIIEPTITGKEMENPVDTGLQSGLRRRMSTLGQKEVGSGRCTVLHWCLGGLFTFA
jgi:hypothetical protein